MLGACLLFACLLVICSGEYYPQDFSPKNLRMYYYARRIQPGYHERMHYSVKPPFRRPYMVYVPKPYIVEVPKALPYVKLPVSQQYHFEKQLSHPYKIEKPIYVHQLPTSLDTKISSDFKVPIESPVSVSVEKQVLLPVNLSDGKKAESIEPSAFMSFPEEVTSHLELAMKKEQLPLSGFEKESILEQLKANGFSQPSLRSQFVSQSEQLSSLDTELPKSWSSESKTVFAPIVVSEKPQNGFNGSEWTPHFEISDIKTITSDKYRLVKPEKDHLEISEVKYPIRDLKLSQDISKYLFPEKSNFLPSQTLESMADLKKSQFEEPFQNGHTSKPSFDFPSSKTYQFYNIESGNVIKPEALTSSIGISKVETEHKDGVRPSHQWLISNGYQKDFQKTVPQLIEQNLKWISPHEPYTSQTESAKKWQTSSETYVVRPESVEEPSKTHGKYESQKEVSQQWSTQDHQLQDQREPDKKWTNGHGQYVIQKESDNVQALKIDQSEQNKNWLKSGDQYIINAKPDQQWLKSGDTKYTSYKYPPRFTIREDQGSKIIEDQSKNRIPYSSQMFLLSPQYGKDDKDPRQSQKYDQDKEYFHFSQQLEGSFKPLIPSHSQSSYSDQIPHSDTNIDTSNHSRLQQYLERKPSSPHEETQSHSNDLLQSQISNVQSSLRKLEDPSTVERQVYQQNAMLKVDNAHPTSTTNNQQYFRNHQFYQEPQDVMAKIQDAHQIRGSSAHSYPQYTSSPQRHSGNWKDTSPTAYQQNTGGEQKDGSSSLEDQEGKVKFRQPESGIFGQKRRHQQQSRGETGYSDQIMRSNRVSTTNTTEELTTAVVPSSTTSQSRRKLRRKHRRRSQETTVHPNEK